VKNDRKASKDKKRRGQKMREQKIKRMTENSAKVQNDWETTERE
jgi:hypothetical protein